MILENHQQFASPEEALEHFGVKGMRWGVRKQDDPAKADAKWQKEQFGTSGKKYEQPKADKTLLKAAKSDIRKGVNEVNNRPEYKGVNFNHQSKKDGGALKKQYENDHYESFKAAMKKNEGVLPPSPSGKKKLEFRAHKDDTWGVYIREIKHADSAPFLRARPVWNTTSGQIVDIEFMNEPTTSDGVVQNILKSVGSVRLLP